MKALKGKNEFFKGHLYTVNRSVINPELNNKTVEVKYSLLGYPTLHRVKFNKKLYWENDTTLGLTNSYEYVLEDIRNTIKLLDKINNKE